MRNPLEMPASLLAYLRNQLCEAVEFSEEPQASAGGYETAIYAFRLTGVPPEFAGPLILRVYPGFVDPARVTYEKTVHDTLVAGAYPAPRVLLASTDVETLGGGFLVMERLPGKTLTEDFFQLSTILHGLAAGIGWALKHRPNEHDEVLCHGDFHPFNVMSERGEISGVIDWSLATMASPAFDVGNTLMILGLASGAGRGGLASALRRSTAKRYLSHYQKERRAAAGHGGGPATTRPIAACSRWSGPPRTGSCARNSRRCVRVPGMRLRSRVGC